jgi:phage terminase large subunit GpA-like protein
MQVQELTAQWSALWRPPEELSLSDWAERNIILSPEYSARTGPLTLYGWQRGILDAFTDPTVETIVIQTATQLIKTLFIQVATAYAIASAPAPILIVEPKEDDAETFSKERLDPMIRDCPIFKGRVGSGSGKAKDPLNTTLFKRFQGGSLSLVGAGVPGNAARRSICYAFLDEIDKYVKDVGDEGDFIDLVRERTATFGSRRKIILACSPTTKGSSRIAKAYDQSDQRKPWVQCHACGEWQVLLWDSVKFDKVAADGQLLRREDRPQTARIECKHCGAGWNDVQRWSACERAEWRASNGFKGVAGFWISHLYSPWKTLPQIVDKFLDAKDDPNTHKVFVNTNLAELWEERGEAPEWQRLYENRETYEQRTVPAGGLFCVAGGDVQKDRIEVQVVAFGRGKESWLVDYEIFAGDTSRPEPWRELDSYLERTFRHESGAELPIVRFAIDSGYATQEVYAWARTKDPSKVLVVKGHESGSVPIGQPGTVDVSHLGKKVRRGVKVWPVATSMLKGQLYGWLRQLRPTEEELLTGGNFPPGFCHFYQENEEFFRQLTAEQLVAREVKGYKKHEWTKTRDRNEALDTRVYALAAAVQFGMDRFQEKHWAALEAQFKNVAPLPPAPEQKSAEAEAAPIVASNPTVQPQVEEPKREAWQDRERRGNWLGDLKSKWSLR